MAPRPGGRPGRRGSGRRRAGPCRRPCGLRRWPRWSGGGWGSRESRRRASRRSCWWLRPGWRWSTATAGSGAQGGAGRTAAGHDRGPVRGAGVRAHLDRADRPSGVGSPARSCPSTSGPRRGVYLACVGRARGGTRGGARCRPRRGWGRARAARWCHRRRVRFRRARPPARGRCTFLTGANLSADRHIHFSAAVGLFAGDVRRGFDRDRPLSQKKDEAGNQSFQVRSCSRQAFSDTSPQWCQLVRPCDDERATGRRIPPARGQHPRAGKCQGEFL